VREKFLDGQDGQVVFAQNHQIQTLTPNLRKYIFPEIDDERSRLENEAWHYDQYLGSD